jgi:hypothetical protein
MHSQKNNIYENEVEEEEEGKVFSVKIKIENRTNECETMLHHLLRTHI